MSMQNSIKFSQRLKQIREGREMTQQELADKTGMMQSAIAHFEEIVVNHLFKISEFLLKL